MPAQIFYSLSERHMHKEFKSSDINCSDVRAPLDMLFLVLEHLAHLPRMHPQQGCQRDTALLMVSLSLTQGASRV